MLSLVLTALLGLFCYSGVVDDRLSCEANNDLVCGDVTESPSIKNFGYIDEYGIQAYFTEADFMSDSFINSLIKHVADITGSEYYYLSLNDYTHSFDVVFSGLNSYFYITNRGVVDTSVSLPVSRITIHKDTPVYFSSTDNYEMVYYLSFWDSSNNINLEYKYFIGVPYLDESEHDLGAVCYRVIRNVYSSNMDRFVQFFVYHENNNDGFSPLIHYVIDTTIEGGYDRTDYNVGYRNGYYVGYQDGYGLGYADAMGTDITASTIFTGILDVALIPVNVFLTIFNFEVFGINIAGIVSALLTISVVVIIIRFVTGKKDD